MSKIKEYIETTKQIKKIENSLKNKNKGDYSKSNFYIFWLLILGSLLLGSFYLVNGMLYEAAKIKGVSFFSFLFSFDDLFLFSEYYSTKLNLHFEGFFLKACIISLVGYLITYVSSKKFLFKNMSKEQLQLSKVVWITTIPIVFLFHWLCLFLPFYYFLFFSIIIFGVKTFNFSRRMIKDEDIVSTKKKLDNMEIKLSKLFFSIVNSRDELEDLVYIQSNIESEKEILKNLKNGVVQCIQSNNPNDIILNHIQATEKETIMND